MSNLLDRSSLVLTPTAYNNGEALCIKPDDASGDFQFSRNSAATRVNAQGLVENVQILSSNLVQNPSFSEQGSEEVSNGSFSQEGSEELANSDFTNGLTSWNGSGYTVVNNQLITNSTGLFYQPLSLTANKTFKAEINIESISQGGVKFYCQGNQSATITTSGVHTIYIVSGSSNSLVGINPQGTFEAVVNSISVREVGQDWSLGTGWSIGEDKAISDGLSNFENIYQTISPNLVIGNSYLISFDLIVTSGALRIRTNAGTYYSNVFNTSGNQSVTLKLENGSDFWFNSYSGFEGSITNISVKEVGQNWTLGGTAAIGDNLVNINSPSGENAEVYQSSVLVIGRKYKLDCTLNKTSGDTQFVNGGTFILNNGSNVIQFTATDTRVYFKRGAGSVISSITNISVIEITSDTSLPRISYENFSYQDALGSELVVNGDFATDSDWGMQSNWTIANGSANSNGSGLIYQTSVSYIDGKTYKVTFDADITSGSGTVRLGNTTAATAFVNGSNEFYLQTDASNTTRYIFFYGNSLVGSIDNVSVKEYLGQSVVPESGCGSWLFEPQRTNRITQSQNFGDASWGKVNSNITINNQISPDGTLNASLMASTSAGSYISDSLATYDPSSFSIFVKYIDQQFVQLYSGASGNFYATFDIQNQVIGASGAYTSNLKIENYGNNWYRISCVFTGAAVGSSVRIGFAQSLTSTWGGLNTSFGTSLLLYGAMLENGSNATSYIPTEGSSVTRNQDLCTGGGSLASINSTEGVLYAEISAFSGGNTDRQITINDGTTSDRLSIALLSNGTQINFVVVSGGAVSVNKSVTIPTITSGTKIAFAYKANDFKIYANGVLIGSDTSGAVPIGLSNLSFDRGDGNDKFYGKTKAVAVWKEALSDQELADLTYPTPTFPTFTLDFNTIAEQFTFARGSEATYVDAQGLIKSTNVLGSELVLNGNFSSDTDWVKGTGTTISGGTANFSSAGSIGLYQNIGTQTGYVKVEFTVTSYTSGTLNVYSGSNQSVGNINVSANALGTYTAYVDRTGGNVNIVFGSSDNFIGSIDNVSIKEVITATNTPRLDYSTGAEAFLLEPQSTNLFTYSELFSNSSWLKSQATATLTSEISPSGTTNNVYNYVGNDANIYTTSQAINIEYTISCYVKSNGQGKDTFTLRLGNDRSGVFTATSEWKRYSFTHTPTTSVFSISTNALLDADILIWGAQLEQKSYATSYIKSEGSQTTRNQETCINATPEINSEEGTLYAEIAALSNDLTFRTITLSDGTTNNNVGFGYRNNSNVIYTFLQGVINSSSIVAVSDITSVNKIAIKYKSGDFSMFVNGIKVFTSTTAFTLTGLNELSFDNGAGAANFFGNTKDVQVYTKALSDAELIKLTTI